MNITPHKEFVYTVCKGLTKRYYDEDYRDLAHDVFVRLIAVDDTIKPISNTYIRSMCYNLFKDRLKYKNIRKDESLYLDMISALTIHTNLTSDELVDQLYFVEPTQEVEVLAKELNIDIHFWPHNNSAVKLNLLEEPVSLRRRQLAVDRAQRNRDIKKGLARLEVYNNLFR